jgi:hypothetical protein
VVPPIPAPRVEQPRSLRRLRRGFACMLPLNRFPNFLGNRFCSRDLVLAC